jgi:hypothetical protein
MTVTDTMFVQLRLLENSHPSPPTTTTHPPTPTVTIAGVSDASCLQRQFPWIVEVLWGCMRGFATTCQWSSTVVVAQKFKTTQNPRNSKKSAAQCRNPDEGSRSSGATCQFSRITAINFSMPSSGKVVPDVHGCQARRDRLPAP